MASLTVNCDLNSNTEIAESHLKLLIFRKFVNILNLDELSDQEQVVRCLDTTKF